MKEDDLTGKAVTITVCVNKNFTFLITCMAMEH